MVKSILSQLLGKPLLKYLTACAALVAAPFLIWPGLLPKVFESNDFMPHIFCLQQDPGLVWLHVVSDSLIGLAYVPISATLVYFVYRKSNLPFHWMFLAFGTFIVACGGTHFMEIYTLWVPTYWLSGGLKALTAIASVTTAALLPPLVPKALALPSPTELLRMNDVLVTEIAERKRAEGILRDSEERFRLVVEQVKDYAIQMLDREGNAVSWNAGVERINGYRADEIIGKHFTIFYTPEEREDKVPSRDLATAFEEGRFEAEGWRVRKDGSEFWANVVITALRDENGNPRGFSVVTRDVSERKQAEDRIRKLNTILEQHSDHLEAANKELEAFTYSVSHDLRAPLRHINGYADLLAESSLSALDDTGRSHLEVISDSARRMGRLIDDLLRFSRTARAEVRLARVNLGRLAEEIWRDLERDSEGRKIIWEVGKLPEVSGDPALLRIVFTNLLSNAVKYTRLRDEARISIGCLDEDPDETVVFVKDNGAGFDMRYVDKLFGVFQRLHRSDEFEGTGIGLATVRRIVHRHGGRTWAEGAPGVGATFFFSLPVIAQGGDHEPSQTNSSR